MFRIKNENVKWFFYDCFSVNDGVKKGLEDRQRQILTQGN